MMARCSGRDTAVRSSRPIVNCPVAAHVQQNVIGHIDQNLRLAQRNQRLMERDVRLGVLLDVILRETILVEILEEVAQRRNVFFGAPWS